MKQNMSLGELIQQYPVCEAVSKKLETLIDLKDKVDNIEFGGILQGRVSDTTKSVIEETVDDLKRALNDFMMLSAIYLKEEMDVEDMLNEMYEYYQKEEIENKE